MTLATSNTPKKTVQSVCQVRSLETVRMGSCGSTRVVAKLLPFDWDFDGVEHVVDDLVGAVSA